MRPHQGFLKDSYQGFLFFIRREGVKSENFSVEEREGNRESTDGSVRKKRSF